ncbi:hypothetical protein PR202_gb03582 [Eleusine coracana subsp. coracana]|uniref:Uncharacterized protein n=1 Tax=Eleusine coracana subsp. coracana TaxID=191504 RepID=A0AAV5E2D5_ELECO|nr:hypothetical protein PR202_gb03582 [Eleusine coracana subsp. coracana]
MHACMVKTDVYSFGVLLLLLTGRRAVDSTRPSNQQLLVAWARPMLHDGKRYRELADPLLLLLLSKAAIGFIVLLVSLAGFIGGCYHVTCALWLYLLLVALLGMTVFGLAVTAGGGGVTQAVPGFRSMPSSTATGGLLSHVSKITTWTPLDYLQHANTGPLCSSAAP